MKRTPRQTSYESDLNPGTRKRGPLFPRIVNATQCHSPGMDVFEDYDVEIMGEDSLCPHMLAIGSLDLVIKGTLCVLILP